MGNCLHRDACGRAPELSMQTFASQYARIRALLVAGQPLPQELGEWTLQQLGDMASAEYLRRRRDALLVQAAEMIGGSLRSKAMGILDEDARLQRIWHSMASHEPDLNTLRGTVHAARLILPIPAERRLRTIIAEAERGRRKSWQPAAL